MDEEEADNLRAQVDAHERLFGALAKTLIKHVPEAEETLIRGLQVFAHHARQENLHTQEIDLYVRMVLWLQRDAEIRKGGSTKTDPN